LINCVGTVDEDYRGEVCVAVVNLSNETYTIQPDERIAQMVIAKVEQAEIKVAVELSNTSRGEGGFGSTGK
jgi:dUTP pyrophosphatase